MEFTDTHTHLYDEAFSGEEDCAVERAVSAGVTKMILPDIDSHTREAMFTLAGRHAGVLFPCIGLHPTSVGADWKQELEKVMSFTGHKVWAVGEIGMDLYWSREFAKEQEEVLRIQLEMASKAGLPVIIHSREATEPLLRILKECRSLGLRGVFHAFSGSAETFRELSRLGEWYIGIGGVLTYKNASIAQTAKDIPADRILLETDSPYLTPVPFRGRRNESVNIPLIASKLAGLTGTDTAEIAVRTTENAKKLFMI